MTTATNALIMLGPTRVRPVLAKPDAAALARGRASLDRRGITGNDRHHPDESASGRAARKPGPHAFADRRDVAGHSHVGAKILDTMCSTIPRIHCLLYLLPTAYCLLPTAYCLLPTAYCDQDHLVRTFSLCQVYGRARDLNDVLCPRLDHLLQGHVRAGRAPFWLLVPIIDVALLFHPKSDSM